MHASGLPALVPAGTRSPLFWVLTLQKPTPTRAANMMTVNPVAASGRGSHHAQTLASAWSRLLLASMSPRRPQHEVVASLRGASEMQQATGKALQSDDGGLGRRCGGSRSVSEAPSQPRFT